MQGMFPEAFQTMQGISQAGRQYYGYAPFTFYEQFLPGSLAGVGVSNSVGTVASSSTDWRARSTYVQSNR